MIELKNKNVVVFGLGVSGLSALKLLKNLGANTYAINGGKIENWAKTPGVLDYCALDHCFSEENDEHQKILESADLLILSPGIPRDHQILNPIHQRNIPIWGEIELGFQVIKKAGALAPIIAITGTNGKTTTTTFLGEIIKDQNKTVFVGGNIGIPFCDMGLEVIIEKKRYDFILLELSSFQLESIVDFHANIGMILNVFQNHGERYSDILDYANAKFNIVKNMNADDVLILPSDYPIIANWSKHLKNKVIEFDTQTVHVDYNLNNFKLPGHHNRVNLKFITIVCELLNFDRTLVQKSIDQFNGVHHRIEFVPSKYLFKAYNDAKSTNWDATITAVIAMDDVAGDLYLIIGGKPRGHGDSILPFMGNLKNKVKRFYAIGEMGPMIHSEINNIVDCRLKKNLDEVIEEVSKENFIGKLLFSPGFPSFDQYANYAARGEHFVKLISK